MPMNVEELCQKAKELPDVDKLALVDALLAQLDRPDPELDDQRRRYYRLTGLGGQVAEVESRRLAVLAALAKVKHVMAFEGR